MLDVARTRWFLVVSGFSLLLSATLGFLYVPDAYITAGWDNMAWLGCSLLGVNSCIREVKA